MDAAALQFFRQPRPRPSPARAQIEHAVRAAALDSLAQFRQDIAVRLADAQQDLQIVRHRIAQKRRKPRLVVYLDELHSTH